MMVSVNAEDLAAVVALACLTESRTNDEQRSLLAVAERLDKKRNAKVSTNVHPAKGAKWALLPEDQRTSDNADDWLVLILPLSRTEQAVHHSRVFYEDDEKHVKPSWERKKKR